MLKGHTKVELFDALTGKKQEEVEKDNLVTNAVQYALAFIGRAEKSPDEVLIPLAKKGLGGILLFDGTLEEDVNNTAFPASVHLVGYSDRTTNSDIAMRGSFNSLESHRTATGYVSVWDFSTSQANGTIDHADKVPHHAWEEGDGREVSRWRACYSAGRTSAPP